MVIRVTRSKARSFSHDESGALLVFFGLCCAALFLVAALSFDLGRRASTQSEMQSFTDNVALTAAGELNGKPGAISRAKRAANDLIQDDIVFGTAGGDRVLSSATDYNIYFYEALPDDDLDPYLTALDQTLPASDFVARYVRVAMNEEKRVTVPWVFGRVLSVFSDAPLPDERVEAESVAGYTSLACDIAPVFFCMPDPDPSDGDSATFWDPVNHIGEQVLLRTGQQGSSFWDSGNFGWLDVREQVPAESLVDEDGDCAGLKGSTLLVCLIAAENAVTTCFENGLLTTLPGQKEGIESAVFNTRFDMYNAKTSGYASNPNFQPAPIVTRGFGPKDGTPDPCLKNATADIQTNAFPLDDCYDGVSGGGCEAYGGVVRFGDGDWDRGRMEYVEANFSVDYDSFDMTTPYEPNILDVAGNPDPDATVISDETVEIPILADDGSVESYQYYHHDDPFRPTYPGEVDPTPNFPTLPIGSTRWEYYVAEVMVTYYSNPKTAFDSYMGDYESFSFIPRKAKDSFTSADSMLKPLIQVIPDDPATVDVDESATIEHHRTDFSETGLPQCATTEESSPANFSLDPRRRVFIAAVVDCEAQKVTGKTDDVLATHFVETFLTQPVKGDPTDAKKFDMYLEIIGPSLTGGEDSTAPGRFRNLVQLYR